MRTAAIFFLLCLSAAPAADQPPIPGLAIDGRKYQHVRVQTVRPTDLILRHETGIIRVPLDKLPEPLRSKYYDPQKLAAAKKEQADKQAAKSREASRQQQLQAELWKEKHMAWREDKLVTLDSLASIDGDVISLTDEGALINRGKLWDYATVFVRCLPETLPELRTDKGYTFHCYKIGSYTYTSVQGAKRVVDAYAEAKPYVSTILHPPAAPGKAAPPQ